MKKNQQWDRSVLKRTFLKILLTMKLSVLIIFITILQVSASVYSQNTLLDLQVEDKTMREVFKVIEQKSDFRFFFNDEFSDLSKNFNLNISEKKIDDIMALILEDSEVTYRILENNVIVITPVPSETGLQQRIITGTVTEASTGNPIPGVNIAVTGTTTGTMTDINGKYTIEIPQGAKSLTFSFVGMETQEINIGTLTRIDVTLAESAIGLDEVVVTALGIKRQEKTLTYATQTVPLEDLVRTGELNIMNSISGQAAGIDIKKSSSGAGGSTRVVLRGDKSLSGDSEPLYVIDGIPMTNVKGQQVTFWGGVDGGDGLSQLNPDDIESISILKGSNAALLYGSQGANGVIMITTKKGKEGAVKVSINSGISFDNVMLLPEMQYKYGSEGGSDESWSYTPGNYDDTFIKDFFQNGQNLQNSISISGGTGRTTSYFSYANVTAKGIVPTNKYQKNNLTFRQSLKLFEDRLTISSNIMLTSENTHNKYTASYRGLLPELYLFPRDLNFNQYKNYEVFDTGRNMMLPNWYTTDSDNPYWFLYKRPLTDNNKRIIGSATLQYDLSKKISVQIRGNYDFALVLRDRQSAAGSQPSEAHENGAWEYHKYTNELIYTDAILKYDDNFGSFSLNTIVGASYQKTMYGDGVSVQTWTDGLLFPNEFSFQNVPDNVQISSTFSERLVKQGLFANATIGFKEMLYLDLSGRNDWASSLAGTGNDSYFYPMFGLTAIFSEMIELPAFIDFAKLRVSHSTVAHEVPFNRIFPQHSINVGGGVDRNTTKPFTNLKPEMLRSFEIGTDWRFFEGIAGLDFTYYNINSQDQFIVLPAPTGSGYTDYYVNAGEIINKGVEFTFNITPVRTNNFSWNTAFNYSRNDNEVVELHPDLKNPIGTGVDEGFESKFVAGGSIGDIYVYKFQRDEQGRIKLDPGNSTPLRTSTSEYIGNLNPDWSLGWNNRFSFGNIDFSFLINGKMGGKAVSQTQAMLDGYGVSKRTADARDNGGVEINGVQEDTPVSKIDAWVYYSTIGGRNGIKEPYVYDRTNIRLNQLALSYTFDMAKLKLPIDNAIISFVGQNLFFIYLKAPFDPDLAMNTSRNYQSLDVYNMPATRNLGFNLKITF